MIKMVYTDLKEIQIKIYHQANKIIKCLVYHKIVRLVIKISNNNILIEHHKLLLMELIISYYNPQ